MPIRFTPIKFPLKMRGVDIRNLDDLQKNFDLNAAVEYFRNGKLIQWLKARYHNDEAEKVSGIDGGLRETFGIFFGTHDVWNIVGMYGEPPTAQKKMLIKMICGDAYTERDLIHLRATSDFSAGWALTKDAFCVGGRLTLNSAGRERKKFFYREIATVDNDWGFFYVVDRENYSWNLDKYHDATILNDAIKKQLANFLNQAKG